MKNYESIVKELEKRLEQKYGNKIELRSVKDETLNYFDEINYITIKKFLIKFNFVLLYLHKEYEKELCLKQINNYMQKTKTSPTFILVLDGNAKSENIEMSLFNEQYLTFIHILVVNNDTCVYETDLHYSGVKDAYAIMEEIKGLIEN